MKVVINDCYGGFSLSPKGTKRYAELKAGRPCHFFVGGLRDPYHEISEAEAGESMFWMAFDTTDIPAVFQKPWALRSPDEKEEVNAWYNAHHIDTRPESRHDPVLIQVVEELGAEADGMYARLKVVEIPDGVEYVIEEYDGLEHIAEAHRTWS